MARLVIVSEIYFRFSIQFYESITLILSFFKKREIAFYYNFFLYNTRKEYNKVSNVKIRTSDLFIEHSIKLHLKSALVVIVILKTLCNN